MKAVTWHGRRDVRVEDVPDPRIEEPTDAIVRITSTAICGSHLHLYELMSPFLEEGDVLGNEPMGIVEEVGSEVTQITPRRQSRHPVQHRVRLVLHVQPRAPVTVRDGAGTRAGARRDAPRLHEAVRPGPRRTG